MGLNTDFNQSPYYDDFDEANNFHRVLFKPGVAVQARELTQLQSILQNQVERFGNNILKEGTVVEGCNFNEITDLNYVKILDLNTNGQPVPISNYVGAKIVGSSTEITGIIQTYADGLESQNPNLNTLFIKYTGTATANSSTKSFEPTENLEIRYVGNNALIDTVTAAGSVLDVPSQAVGNAYGVRVGEGIIYQKGFFVKVDPQLAIVSKYTNAPTDLVVGFLTEESIINSNIDPDLLDNANGFNNYQAPGGDRLKLTPILTVLSKSDALDEEKFFAIQEYMYGKVVRRNTTTQYNGIMTAMEQRTKEESGNYAVKEFSIFASENTTIMDADELTIGKSYIITQLGTIDFTTIGASSSNVGVIFTATGVPVGTGYVRENSLDLNIGAGLAYVEGKRVELLNKISVDLPKSDSYDTEVLQSISTNFGNYILVKEYMGSFDFNKGATINLFNGYQTAATDLSIGANNGISIGTAKVLSMEYDSGTMGTATATYKMYLSDIKMNISNTTITGASSNGTSFIYVDNNNYTVGTKISITGVNPVTYNLADQTITTANATHFTIANTSTAGAYANGGVATVVGIWDDVKSAVYANTAQADLVDNTIYDQQFKRRLFTVGRDSLKALPAATTSAEYTFRSVANTISFANTGTIVTAFTPPLGNLPYGGTLTSTQKNDFVLISGTTVSVGGSPVHVKDKPIDLSTATMSVTGNALSISIPAYANTISLTGCTLYYNARRPAIAAPTSKVLETVYVKINCANNAATSVGPWSLGFPDVYKIENVYVGTGGTYPDENSSTDNTSYFVLNDNQKDDFYGISTISKKAGLVLTGNSTIIAKVTRFKKTGTDFGFFTVSSYPIDDVNTANTSAIQTYNIPSYTSSNNTVYDLRDVVDFRLYAVNTATNAANSSVATVNPSNSITFNTGSELYLPAANKSLTTDYSYYLARKDYLMIDSSGNIVVKSGTPADKPIAPQDPNTGMVLADITIPEYPSLSWSAATKLNKKRYGVVINPRTHRRYTMEDIGRIDNRINKLEYYSALSLLETDTKDLIITDSTGANRFKNGILADNFKDLLGADLFNPDFTSGYDITNQEILPKFREFPLHLKRDTSSGATDVNVRYYKNSLTLNDPENFKIIEQPYATYHSQTVTNTTVTNGYVQIYPHYDLGKDTIITPEPVGQAGVDLWDYSGGGLSVKLNGKVATKTFDAAYARPQDIRIKVTGLKPNTKYWVFVNGKVTNVLPGHYTSGDDIRYIATGYGNRDKSESIHGDWQHDIKELYYEGGEMGVYSNSKGEMLSVLYLPPNNLKVGKHTIQVYEAKKLPLSGTGIATAIYSAFSDGTGVGFSTGVENPMAPISFVTGAATTTTTNNINDTTVCEHLAQTFTIKRTMGKDSLIEIDTIDLYFKSKPTSTTGRGITVNLCGTRNGQPDPGMILGSKYLQNSEIFVSDTAATKTPVGFDELIVLKTDATYCIIIISDAHDPDFRAWIARSGDKDLIKQIAVTKDTFTGLLYSSTNGTSWTANDKDNLKFTLYKNHYAQSGITYLTNNDHEFLRVKPSGVTYTDNKGHTFGDVFASNELVVKVTANLTPTITTTTSSYSVTTSASLIGTFGQNDWLAYYAIDHNGNLVVDAAQVKSISTTSITLDRVPQYANTAAKVFKTIVGNVSYYNKNDNVLHLMDSSVVIGASSPWKFETDNYIWGTKSSCTANVVSVDAVGVSLMQGNIEEYNYSYTDTKYVLDFIAGPGPSYTRINTDQPISLIDEIPYQKYSCTIPSQSLESEQGFRIKALLNNTGSAPYDSTPIINYKKGLMHVFEHAVNNDSTGETLPSGGNALSKYITKQVTLAENLDAEDLRVYLTAYRPSGGTIEVYARFKNKNDQRSPNEIEWTKLTLKDSTNLTSSVSDLFDYREFEYNMPTASSIPTSGAVLNTSNSNKLSYKDPDGVSYIGYKFFAIKIVLLAADHNIVPRVKNLRAIALT